MQSSCVIRESELPIDIVYHITSYVRQDKCIVCYHTCSFQRKINNAPQTVCGVVCQLKRDTTMVAYRVYSTCSSITVYVVYISAYIAAHILIVALWMIAMIAQIYMVVLVGCKIVVNRMRLFSYFVAIVEWVVLIESVFHIKRRIAW